MSVIPDHFVSFQPARILVADDDPILREFASVHLATPSVEVEVAEDGEVAQERLRKGGVDLALVDLSMPRMDGFELIAAVRADRTLRNARVEAELRREVEALQGMNAARSEMLRLRRDSVARSAHTLRERMAKLTTDAAVSGEVLGMADKLGALYEQMDQAMRMLGAEDQDLSR